VIYEYADKTPQGCAVQAAFGPMSGRKKRQTDGGASFSSSKGPTTFVEDLLEEFGFKMPRPKDNNGTVGSLHLRPKRDVRSVQKFIELALIIDQAMVRSI
jgi:hypothetical protein